MITTLDLLTAHPFLEGLPAPWLERLTYQAKRAVYHGGRRLFREGNRAEHFWLIREGRVALEFNVPGRGDIVIEQLGPGGVLGWSWMFPPYRWHFGAVAAEQTLAIEFDGPGVHRLCEEDPALGYELTRRFAAVLIDRLQAARLRLVDVYGYPAEQSMA
jgi:CRP/FNR family transcriptional regulator, cyclic AMP receptor protein